jgi:hypothetical protein
VINDNKRSAFRNSGAVRTNLPRPCHAQFPRSSQSDIHIAFCGSSLFSVGGNQKDGLPRRRRFDKLTALSLPKGRDAGNTDATRISRWAQGRRGTLNEKTLRASAPLRENPFSFGIPPPSGFPVATPTPIAFNLHCS